MKKVLYIGLFLSIAASCMLTGCGNQGNDSSSSEVTESNEDEISASEEPTEAAEEETEAATEEKAEAAPITSDTLWADFDNMTFTINGKTYKLGETTLQEMIDDGVPFDEDDIANAGNNVNKNYETPAFDIVLGDYQFAQVRGLNDTSENKPANECYLTSIYMPVDQEESQDILQFNFPLNITKDDLLTNSGEPEDPDDIYIYDSDDGSFHKESYKYRKESEKYFGDSTYNFEFINGELAYVTISYTP